jgi:hypothetical protein
LRSAYKDLEAKLKVAEEKQKRAETQLAEKNSDFIREKADLVARHQKDGTVIKDL